MQSPTLYETVYVEHEAWTVVGITEGRRPIVVPAQRVGGQGFWPSNTHRPWAEEARYLNPDGSLSRT